MDKKSEISQKSMGKSRIKNIGAEFDERFFTEPKINIFIEDFLNKDICFVNC